MIHTSWFSLSYCFYYQSNKTNTIVTVSSCRKKIHVKCLWLCASIFLTYRSIRYPSKSRYFPQTSDRTNNWLSESSHSSTTNTDRHGHCCGTVQDRIHVEIHSIVWGKVKWKTVFRRAQFSPTLFTVECRQQSVHSMGINVYDIAYRNRMYAMKRMYILYV